MTPQKLTDIINQAGFPLQIALTNVVRQTHDDHGWRVLYKEHAWSNSRDGTDGFIDLALENRHGTAVLVIECKRVLGSSWIFLQPGNQLGDKRRAHAWVSRFARDDFLSFNWVDLALDPASPESEFCSVPGQGPNDRPMLERIASYAASSTEALAYEEQGFLPRKVDALRMYFTVIVTTATLRVCSFEPSEISLEDGKLGHGIFSEVPFVRFRKQLSTLPPPITIAETDDHGLLVRAKERTVFVVNSAALHAFLCAFAIDSAPLRHLI